MKDDAPQAASNSDTFLSKGNVYIMNTLNLRTRRPFQMIRGVLQVWKYAYRPFLLFELFYKLMTIGLFIPFVSIVFNKILEIGGFGAAANHDLLRFALSRYGLLSLVLLAPVAMMLIYTEFAVLIYIAYYGMQGQTVRLRAVVLKALSRLPGLWRIGIFGLALYLLLLFPLLNTGFGSSLLPNVTIPNFITGELMKTSTGTAAFVLFFTIVAILNLLCIYALPILVLEDSNRFWRAFAKSARLFWKSKWSILRAVGEWVLVFVLIVAVFIALIAAAIAVLPESLPETAIVTVGFVISFGVYVMTLVMTPLFITVVTRLYVRYAGKKHISLHSGELDITEGHTRAERRLFASQHRPKLALFGLMMLIAVGWGVTALLTDWGEAKDEFVIIAHRGNMNTGVENTLDAFEGAVEAGADYIELDILQTKDRKLAVIHDHNLKRLARHNVNVYDLTLAELQDIPLFQNGYAGRIPSLDEVLDAMKGRIRLNLELKTHGYETPDYVSSFIDTIRQHQAENEVVVSSLEYDLLQEVKEKAPELKVGYIIYATFAPLNRFDADFFVVEEAFVTARLVASAKLIGKPLYVWTINDPERAAHFYSLGVDGIITDIPKEAREAVKELGGDPVFLLELE